MSLCSVKPAVLDLVLAISILLYMGGVYLLVMVRRIMVIISIISFSLR